MSLGKSYVESLVVRLVSVSSYEPRLVVCVNFLVRTLRPPPWFVLSFLFPFGLLAVGARPVSDPLAGFWEPIPHTGLSYQALT